MLPLCSTATFVNASGTPTPMCGRAATCTDQPIADVATAPTSPRCSCTGEAYDPAWPNSSLAPYQTSSTDRSHDGCLVPVRATTLTHVEVQALAVSLTKNETSAESRPADLTLTLNGTDWNNGSDYTWTLASTAPTWLHIPRTTGSVAASPGSERATTTVPIMVYSVGLRDANPATATVSILFTPRSSVPGRSPAPQFLNITVTTYVSAVAVVATSSFETSSARAYVGVDAIFEFVARDVDGVQLNHGEVTRFSANLTHEGTGEVVPTHLTYWHDGTYNVSATPHLLGSYALGMTLKEAGVSTKVPSTMRVEVGCPEPTVPIPGGGGCGCGPGTEPNGEGGCINCTAGSYAPSIGSLFTQGSCIPCPGAHVTSEPGADSLTGCRCAASYFNDTSASDGARCVACTDSESCGHPSNAVPGVTLAGLNLSTGRWRLGNLTKDIRPCAGPCVGGIGPGYCASGYKGPLCSVCANTWHYFKGGRCHVCRQHGVAANVLPLCGLLVGLCVAALLARCVRRRQILPRHGTGSTVSVWPEERWQRTVDLASRLGVLPKLKLLLGYYQVVVAIPLCYDAHLPPEYLDAMRVFEFIHFDWVRQRCGSVCCGFAGTCAPATRRCVAPGCSLIRR